MPFPPSKRKHRRAKLAVATIMLTSLMDVMTIILVFLLKSFSAEGDILAADPRLRLPASTSKEVPRLKLIVQVSTDDILLEGVKVADVGKVIEGRELLIKPLADALERHTEKVEFLAKKNPAIKFAGEVLIQGDRRIPFALLKKIMYSCGQAGYGNISLAVMYSE
jgi:biopolymer transport protein ExbD